MGNPFRSRSLELRAVSYQSVWGTGADLVDRDNTYSPAKAMQLAVVTACLQFRSDLIGQLPLKAYIAEGGIDVEARVQPDLVARPSGVVVPSVWRIQMQISRDLWGNAFGRIVTRDGAGYPKQVEWLPPGSVTTTQSVMSGPVRVFIDGSEVPRESVLIVPGRFVMPGSPLGVAPLAATGLVQLAKYAQDFGRDWFANGAVPSTTVYVDREIDDEQAKAISQKITERWRNRKPAVVGTAIARIEHSEIKANESQFLETQRQAQSDICQCFGVKPQWVGLAISGSSVTYQNVATEKQDRLDSMNIDLRVVEDVLSDRNVTPMPMFVNFKTGAYLSSDLASRYASYKTAAEIEQITGDQFLSVDEMRQLENRSPLPRRDPAPVPAQ